MRDLEQLQKLVADNRYIVMGGPSGGRNPAEQYWVTSHDNRNALGRRIHVFGATLLEALDRAVIEAGLGETQ